MRLVSMYWCPVITEHCHYAQPLDIIRVQYMCLCVCMYFVAAHVCLRSRGSCFIISFALFLPHSNTKGVRDIHVTCACVVVPVHAKLPQ